MLDSIREIFDILGIPFESIRYEIEAYNLETEKNELEAELASKTKSFVVGEIENQLLFPGYSGSHALVATGIRQDNSIELKNSYADYPHISGKVRHKQLISSIAAIDYGSHPMIQKFQIAH